MFSRNISSLWFSNVFSRLFFVISITTGKVKTNINLLSIPNSITISIGIRFLRSKILIKISDNSFWTTLSPFSIENRSFHPSRNRWPLEITFFFFFVVYQSCEIRVPTEVYVVYDKFLYSSRVPDSYCVRTDKALWFLHQKHRKIKIIILYFESMAPPVRHFRESNHHGAFCCKAED